jgi:hypothetical protein
MVISQIMLINRDRLAIYANHAGYDLTFFHDYKIVNAIQEYIMQTITTSHSTFERSEQALIHIRGCYGDSNQ